MKYAIARAITCLFEYNSPSATHISVLSFTDTSHGIRKAFGGEVCGQQPFFKKKKTNKKDSSACHLVLVLQQAELTLKLYVWSGRLDPDTERNKGYLYRYLYRYKTFKLCKQCKLLVQHSAAIALFFPKWRMQGTRSNKK